ncbi:MAG TPA: biliverdin-producing heme oxygenase [Burkholderiaceae bacterium]
MSSDTALAELRLTTRADHDRIERILRLDEAMPLARYAAILSRFDAFLRVWEPRIHAALPERLQSWFRARWRGGLASADVQWLRSVAQVRMPPVDVPAAATLPLTDLPEVLGSLYAFEASALGGRAIAPLLKRSLGLGQGSGASYFHGFGGDTAAMWSNYRVLAALEIGDSPRDTVRACMSARRTFGALIDLFAPLAPAQVPAAPRLAVAQRIAPALLMAHAGPDDEDDEATRPAPLADIHIDLPADGEADAGDTLVELPMDDELDGGDTIRMPL